MDASFRVLCTLFLALLLAGCAASGATSDKDPHHGFYGGISTGAALP
ncbi:MAG: hypothetical protein ACREE4_07445 [Stellaceae bacterium]